MTSLEINNKIVTEKSYQVPFEMLYRFIDNLGPKIKQMSDLDVLKKAFEFGYMLVALDKEDMETRIANLNEQNLKWFTKADALEAEVVKLRTQLEKLNQKPAAETSAAKEETFENLSFSEDSLNGSELLFQELTGSLKKPQASEGFLMSSDASMEFTSNLN